MHIAYKQVAIAAGLGIVFGWFFARKLSVIAYEMHLPRPDWDRTGHVGSGWSSQPPLSAEDYTAYCLTNPYDQDCIASSLGH